MESFSHTFNLFPPACLLPKIKRNIAAVHQCIYTIGEKTITKDLLQLIKWKDKLGEMKELRLYDVLARIWKDVSDLLNLDGYTRKNTEMKYPEDSKQCIREVIEQWLNDETKSDCNYKCTWNGLSQLLQDLQLSRVTKQLQEALRADISSFNRNTQMPGKKLSLWCTILIFYYCRWTRTYSLSP